MYVLYATGLVIFKDRIKSLEYLDFFWKGTDFLHKTLV